MAVPILAPPRPASPVEYPLTPKDESRRALAAEVRLMLAAFRQAVGATASALFVYEEEGRLLRLRWSEPRTFRRAVTHPISRGCTLARALEARRPAREGARGRGEEPGCPTCRGLFGAPPVFAVPTWADGGQLAVVAAFGPAADPAGPRSRRGFATAHRLAQHLGIFLRAYTVAQEAQRQALPPAAAEEFATGATPVLHPELLLSRILAEIPPATPYDVASLYGFDPRERRLRIVADRSRRPDRQGWLEGTAWERVSGIVFHSQQSVVVHDLRPFQTQRCTPRQAAMLAGVRSALYVPIVYGGESLGVIGLGSADPDAFSDQERDLLTCLANQAAIEIANAQFSRKADAPPRSRLRELTELSQVGQAIGASLQIGSVLQNIVRGTAEAFRASRATVALVDGQHDELIVASAYGLGSTQTGQRFPVDGSASGWVVRQARPVFVASIPDCPFDRLRLWYERGVGESFIGVPLVVQGKAIGSLTVYSRRGERFDDGDVELLRGMAAQAAIAIEHANLYEFAAREKAKLEAIVESLQEGLCLAGPRGTIVYPSGRFIELLEIAPGLLEGATIEQVWDWLAGCCGAPSEASEKLGALDADPSQAVVLSVARPRPRDLEVQSFGVRTPEGHLLGRGYLVRDISQQVEVERLKASVLSTVSHELRTPLAAIKGFATSLLRDDVEWDEASKRDFLEQIDREADRLGNLVRNLLDMSRLDAGVLRLDREWCDLSDLVLDVAGRMAPLVADHRVDLAVGDTTILALVDRRYLERVIWNLVENAVKYSPRGSAITLGAAREGEEVLLTVRDQGIGIKPEERERVFERFYRVPGTRAPGLGLGLSICRGIVEAHGGTITLESHPGAGTSATVRLPVHG